MKKDIMVHYVKLSEEMQHGYDEFGYPRLDDLKIFFEGGISKKNLLIEKKGYNSVVFDEIVHSHLEDLKKQIPYNFERFFHILLPNYDNHSRQIEIINSEHKKKHKDILNVTSFNFSKDDWEIFSNKIRNFIFKINGKEFSDKFEILLTENRDIHSYVNILETNRTYNTKGYCKEEKTSNY